MSDLELQSIRDFILCAAARFPRGITTFSLNVAVIAAGFELPARGADALEAQLKYLRGKNLLALKAKATPPAPSCTNSRPMATTICGPKNC